MKFQLAIIGAGPAGYTAAELAAKEGLSVVLFEKKCLGGVCLNEGCIPTKTWLRSAHLFEECRESSKYGISCESVSFDLARILVRKQKIIRKLTAGVRKSLVDAGVTFIAEEAQIDSYSDEGIVIKTKEALYEVKDLILATGSETVIPPIEGLTTYWTHREALETQEIPNKLLIVGGGVIGMEFACLFQTLGSEVVVVEMLPEILYQQDHETARFFRETCERRGIRFLLQTKVVSVDGQTALLETNDEKQMLSFDKILLAVGRRPCLQTLQNSPLNFRFENKRLAVNAQMQTSIPHIYACGDITGFSMLAHTAEREAAVAVHAILGIADEMSYQAVPSVVYSSPEVSSVGMTEEEVIANKIDYTTKIMPLSFAGKFVIENEAKNGFIKIILNTKHRIMGIHIVGNPSSEFIVAGGLAVMNQLTVDEWEKVIFPHPTVSEILKIAVK